MNNLPVGFNHKRLLRLIKDAIDRCNLDLSDQIIFTEAATGAYVVTPIIAALAGAKKVYAITKDTPYGTIKQVINETESLANLAGISSNIEIITEKTSDIVSKADLITNSGHVRPINKEMINWMKPSVVISLMYESWEFREEDIDLDYCRKTGIKVIGVNEKHPSIDVFSFLGIMAIKQLLDAGVAVYGSKILLLCDNHFSEFIQKTLSQNGAEVYCHKQLKEAEMQINYDAIIAALKPQKNPVLSEVDLRIIAQNFSDCVIFQFWGDIDLYLCHQLNILIYPDKTIKKGHMGILPSEIGPEAIIRLQTGGLKSGSVVIKKYDIIDRKNIDYIQIV
ncbi:hypothetical protein [Dolichospermum sp. UHCC 0259]|uniref:hypothetical protein n=1 Tax=Dolichospermum sp. UHCC 0259 TaxID=2590010 RepID=UPI001445D703|nr:hypothetical protein [Dolichospermum sp. UHCC 0259]MTJ47262.1 hypothetical protein [Dolichospermum sp. UHCC 0259]